MVLITAAALLTGFIAGATFLAKKQCIDNPTFCEGVGNGTYPYYYYWSYGARIVANTGSGQIKGVTWKSTRGRNFAAFLGIPYAKVEMRWEPSRPFPRWEGVKDASTYGPMCLQLDRKKQIIAGSEDCLFLNTYTPTMNERALLPVMVWIDSSLGWQHGSGDKIDPRNFMDESVVLVTFNFRQSSLGFLSTGDGEIQGNMGLKDQTLALMWVKQNIINFGGDPEKVTIFGHDSGGASVHLHILSPLSKGLFHKGISQSGTAHCPWALQTNPTNKAKTLAHFLNCDFSTTKAMVDCMRFRSGEEVMSAELKMKTGNWNGEPYAIFGPTVEKISYKSSPFLPHSPQEIVANGEFSRVPWIVGLAEEEGRYFVSKVLNSEYLTNEINLNFNKLAPISFFYEETLSSDDSKDAVSSILRSLYLGKWEGIVGRESWENYTNIYTDRYYLSGITESIKAHANTTQVYPYIFKFQGDFNYYTPIIPGDYRFKRAPSHFDELFYLFNWEWSNLQAPSNSNENIYNWEFSKKLIRTWVSFAETGIPRGWGTTPDWLPMSPLNPFVNWYTIDYDTRILREDPYSHRLNFWKDLALVDEVYLNREH